MVQVSYKKSVLYTTIYTNNLKQPKSATVGEDSREDWAPSRNPAAQGRAAGRGLVGERLLQKQGGCGLWELQHQKLYQGRDSGTGSKTSFWNKKNHLPINIYPQVSIFVYC